MKRLMQLGLVACVGGAMFLAGCETTSNVSLGPGGAPEPVMAAFKKSFPDGKVVNIRKKMMKDGTMKYNIEFTDQVGTVRDANYDERGTMVK